MSMETKGHDLASVKALAERYRNWGKWGPDDELGTINYITPQKITEAAALVREPASPRSASRVSSLRLGIGRTVARPPPAQCS